MSDEKEKWPAMTEVLGHSPQGWRITYVCEKLEEKLQTIIEAIRELKAEDKRQQELDK